MNNDTITTPVNSDYILKLFNLENKNIRFIDVHHQFDGVHVSVELEVESHQCPVCGTSTSKINNYVKKRLPIQFLTEFHVILITKLDDINVQNAIKLFLKITHLQSTE